MTHIATKLLQPGETFHVLHGSRVETGNNHGTGCTLASAIAAEMAKGAHMLKAVQVCHPQSLGLLFIHLLNIPRSTSIFCLIQTAKQYVVEALERSKNLEIGKGKNGPLNHLFKVTDWSKQVVPHFKSSDLLLYAITDSSMNKRWQRSMYDAVKSAIEGGATIVQLRFIESQFVLHSGEAEVV